MKKRNNENETTGFEKGKYVSNYFSKYELKCFFNIHVVK